MQPDAFDDHDADAYVVRAHPDGRLWAARADRGLVRLRITDAEGDVWRRTKAPEPRARLAELVREVEAEGFAPLAAPRDALEGWLAAWAERAPAFDAAALRDQVLAAPAGLDAVTAILRLREPLRALGGGAFEVLAEHGRAEHAAARAYLTEHREAAWPAIVLALRCGSTGARERLDQLLAAHGDARAVPALLTFLGQDAPAPVHALAALALPAHLDAFVPALASDAFGVRLVAQHALALRAEHADVERCLFAHVPADITEAEMEMFLVAAERSGDAAHANRLSVWGIRVGNKALAARLAAAARRLNTPPTST